MVLIYKSYIMSSATCTRVNIVKGQSVSKNYFSLCKNIVHLLRLFNICLLLKRKNWCLWKISALFLHTIYSLWWRSIVTCNRCNIVSSHKCLTYTNQTLCTMSFNRKLIKLFGGILQNWEAMFVLIFAWTSRRF